MQQHTLGVLGYLVWILFTIHSSFRLWKNFENRLGFDKVVTISWVVHFWGHSVDGTRRAVIDGYTTAVLWPFNLISMSHVQVHTWPNFGENIYEDIVFTWFFGLLPAVTLIFDLWCQKLISTSTNPNTSVTKTGWNSLSLVVRYGVHKVSGHCLVWPWRLTFWPSEYVPGPDTYIT